MGVNKVVYGGETIMDITDTTATPASMLTGTVAYGANGDRMVGSIGNATETTDGLMSAEDKAALDGHLANSDIHVTQQEKTNWNNKVTAYRNASGALVLTYININP